MVTVFGLVKLGVENNVLEERAQLRVAAESVHNGQAHHNGFAAGNIGKDVIQIQQQIVGIDHVVFCGEHCVHDAGEGTDQASLVNRAAEQLSRGNLRRYVVLNILRSVHLGERNRSKTGNGIVGQHAQAHGIQLIVGVDFINQISIRSLIFKSKAHI